MRIALRPSGGRGDYELAGSYDNLHASDLLEKTFYFEVAPDLMINGAAQAHRLSGKTRIRPENKGGRHAYVFISAILLMPSARRELLKTSEELPRLKESTYTVAGIDVDVVSVEEGRVIFAPTNIWLRSRGGVVKVDYAERMALISTLWNAAKLTTTAEAKLINNHYESAKSGDHGRIVSSASAIQKFYQTDEDVLPLVLRSFGLPDATSIAYSGVSTTSEGFDSEDDDSTLEQSKLERVKKWRKQVDRGPGAREFSINVREAYNYQCLFSGERFPKFPEIASSGVDGAHILPWSTHQLNSISNGLCLCKLCHWAFDNGLFRLEFDGKANGYVLSIPDSVEEGALNVEFDLGKFKNYIGVIDKSRLPKNPDLWPSPKHIQALNASLS